MTWRTPAIVAGAILVFACVNHVRSGRSLAGHFSTPWAMNTFAYFAVRRGPLQKK